MTIDEAIEIKQQNQHWLPHGSFPKLLEADNLSIEALKRIQRMRQDWAFSPLPPLPGETKD